MQVFNDGALIYGTIPTSVGTDIDFIAEIDLNGQVKWRKTVEYDSPAHLDITKYRLSNAHKSRAGDIWLSLAKWGKNESILVPIENWE